MKGKKLVTIKILIDHNNDGFGFDVHYQGFLKPTPLIDQLIISGALDKVKNYIMSDVDKAEIKEEN